METRIQKTLFHWFPEAFVKTDRAAENTDYGVLRQFAHYTKNMILNNSENQKEPFRVILVLYSKGSLFERNAIENEYLYVLALDENPSSLKKHLDLMPGELRSVYIKTIVEN